MMIEGGKIAENIINELKASKKPGKKLVVILVGNNAQSKSFIRQKEKIATALGVSFQLYELNETIPEQELIEKIKDIGQDQNVGGIILQLPLPEKYNRDAVLAAIDPEKDIDALTLESRKFVMPLPVEVVKDVLDSIGEKLENKKIAVVGRGFLVGKPIVEWLDAIKKEYSLFRRESDLSELKKADLVIAGVGRAGLINPEMLKENAIVIDFGYSSENGKLKGDFDPYPILNSQCLIRNSVIYTPTPGGTGPILVAEIFKNFYKLNK